MISLPHRRIPPVPPRADVERARNYKELVRQQDELRVYFWRMGQHDGPDILFANHITLETPHWCAHCGHASDQEQCCFGPHGEQLALPGLGGE